METSTSENPPKNPEEKVNVLPRDLPIATMAQ